NGGPWTRRVDIVSRPDVGQQLLRLLEAPLTHPQVGESTERPASERAVAESRQPDGLGEGRVSLGPASRGGEDAAIVRTAERRNRRQHAPAGDRFPDADPLISSSDVMRVLARCEQLTEDLLEDEEV